MGDDSFETVARAHAGVVSRLAAAYAHRGPDREDLIQDILLQLWRSWPAFRGHASQRTFVYRVAHNVALDHLRRRYRSLEDLVSRDAEAPGVDPMGRLSLEQALRSLRLQSRQVALLALEGLSNAEAAEVLGISEGNAAVRLTRARAELRTLLQEEET